MAQELPPPEETEKESFKLAEQKSEDSESETDSEEEISPDQKNIMRIERINDYKRRKKIPQEEIKKMSFLEKLEMELK